MKPIIKTILFTLISFLIILSILNYSFNVIFDKYHFLKIKENKFDDFVDKNGKDFDLLFVGDSLAHNAIEPKYFTDMTYNYANAGESYMEIYYRLRYQIEENKLNIDYVVLEIDDSMFIKDASEKFFLWAPAYREYMSFNEFKEMFPRKNPVEVYVKYYLPLFGRGVLLGLPLANNKNKLNSDGSINKTSKIISDKLKIQPSLDIKPDERGLEYFNKTVNLLNENNINVIYIKYPLTIYGYHRINEEIYLENEEKVFKIINKNQADYVFLEYTSIFFNNEDYFKDRVHMNQIGGDKFNPILKRDLILNGVLLENQ